MDQQTKVGIGAAAGIALMALLEPHLFESHFILTPLIYLVLVGLLAWGFWPVISICNRSRFASLQLVGGAVSISEFFDDEEVG
jgi:hypothetical protein